MSKVVNPKTSKEQVAIEALPKAGSRVPTSPLEQLLPAEGLASLRKVKPSRQAPVNDLDEEPTESEEDEGAEPRTETTLAAASSTATETSSTASADQVVNPLAPAAAPGALDTAPGKSAEAWSPAIDPQTLRLLTVLGGAVFLSSLGSSGSGNTSTPGVNEAPVRSNTQIDAAGTEDRVKVFTAADLIANYTDPERGPLSVASVGNATNGTVVLNPDGTVSFTPTANYSGAASFSYTVKDASGLQGNATTVNLTVANVNDPVEGSVTVQSANGSNKAGVALTADATGLSDADGLGTLAYQWQQSTDGQNWTDISGATLSSFTPDDALIGQSVRVLISYTDLKGAAEAVSSSSVVVLDPVDPISSSDGAGIDGYLANALVWRDTNEDQQWNAGEPYVFTDASGLFKNLTNGPGTIRLAGLTDELRALLTNESPDPTTDISTGKTFTGILSAPEGASVVTPLTTLVVATGGDPVKLAALQTALGIDPSIDLATYDPLAALVSGNATPAQIAAALQVQTASLKVANLMSMAATAVGSMDANFSLSDLVTSVAQSLVEQASASGGLDLDEPDALSATLQAAATGAGVTIDPDTLTTAATAMASVNTSMTSSVSTAISAAANGLSLNDALSVMTQAVASQLVVQESLLPAVAASASSGGDISINTSSFSGDALQELVNTAKSSVETLVVAPPTQSLMVAVDDFGLINKAGATPWTALSGNLVSNDLSGADAKKILAAVKGTTSTADSLTPFSTELSLIGVYGTLVVKADGRYTYTVTNSGLANTLVTDTFTYQVGSGNSTDLGTLTLTLDARNDAPKVSAVQLALESAGAVSAATADLLAGATDADGDALTVKEIKGQSDFSSTGPWVGKYGSLSFEGGVYTYQLDLANAEVNALAPKATVRDVFLFGVTDGTATTQSAMTVTITGSAVVGSPVLLVDSDSSNNGLNTISESAASDTAVANLQLQGSDADGSTVTLSLVGNANGLFVLDGNQIKLATGKKLDYETASSHTIAVKALSSDGGSVTQSFTISVTDVSEAPVITSGGTVSVAENTSVDTVVYDADATDQDAGTQLVYSLDGTDKALFTINSSTGQIKLQASPNFEAKSSYSIIVIASDGVLSDSKAVTINVTNVNEAPVISSGKNGNVAENAAVNTLVYTATATDVDAGTTLAFSLSGTDAASFDIDASSGAVTLKPSANFEVKSSYNINVIASDGALIDTEAVTINVTNVNEVPFLLQNSPTDFVLINGRALTPIGLASDFADPENNTLTFSLTSALPTGLSFDTSTATFSGTPTTDGSYSVTLRVSDGSLFSDQNYTLRVVSQPVVVSVSADKSAAKAGDPLTFTVTLSESVTIDTTYGTPVLVFDVAGNDMLAEYRAVFGSGTKTATTVLTFVATAIAGTDTQVTIKSLSLGNATITGNLTGQSLSTQTSVSVGNLVVDNSEPVFTSSNYVIVEENIATSTVVYTARATDDTALSYRLWGPNSSAFNLSNGVLTFKNPPDFETFSSYQVCIDATDAAGNTSTQNLIIGVTDVNEAPTAITLNNVISSLPENTSTRSSVKVADIAVTDDALGTNTFTLTGTDAALFEVIGNALYLKSGVVLNHESVKNSYAVTVSVGDANANVNGNTVSAQYTLGVTNVNEAPTYTSGALTDKTVQVGASASIVVPVNAFTDPDVGDTLSYVAYVDGVLIASQNWISFNAATQTFTLNADASQLGAHTLTVEASDGSLAASHTFDLDVTLPVGQGILKSHIAQLTDYLDNPNTSGTADYTQANPSSVTGSFDSISGLLNLGSAALKVTRGNLLNISDGNPDTLGTAPLLSLSLGAVPSGEAKSATLKIALTRGLDSNKASDESQVSVTLNVDMLQVGDQWVMRASGTSAAPQSALVQIRSNSLNFDLPFDFDNSDLIASTSGSGQSLQLDVNAFALLTKLNNSPYGSLLGSFLSDDAYTLSIQQQSGDPLPLLTLTGQALDGIALTLNVDSNTNNQSPFLALGSDLKAIQLAIAPNQILAVGDFLQNGGGTDTNAGPRFALKDPESNLAKIWLLQPQSGTYGLRKSATEITWYTKENYESLSDVLILPLSYSDLGKLVYQAPATFGGSASVAGLGLQFMLEDNQQTFSPLYQLAVQFNGALLTQTLVTEGSAVQTLLTLTTSQDIQSLPTQGKLFFVRGETRTEIKAIGTSLLAGDRLEYEAPAAGGLQASAGEVLLRSFDNAKDTYTFTTLALQVNHLPSLTVTGTPQTVIEDSDTGSTSVTVTVSDIDSNVLSWPDWTDNNGVFSKNLTYGVATLTLVSGGEYTLSYALDPVRSQSLNTTPVNEVLTLVVSDGLGGTVSRTVTFVVQGVNDAAAFVKLDDSTPFDALSITEGSGAVSGRLVVSDIDGPATTVNASQSTGKYGQFEVIESGVWTYTPNGDLNALKAETYTDDFVVTTADGTTKTVTVTIQGVNDAPVPKGFSDNVKINQVATLDLVNGSTDPEGDIFSATEAVLRQGGGQVSLVNGVVTFTPTTNFSGQVYIDYTLQDAGKASSSGVISLFVGNNTLPTGQNASLSTLEDTHLVFSAANFGFEDADLGQSFSAVRIDSLPLAGVLKLDGNNVTAGQVIAAADITKLSFVPVANASATGYASFNFSVRDSAGAYAASPSTVTIDVTPVNDAPTAINLSGNSLAENQTVIGGVKVGDITIIDPDTSGNNNKLSVSDTTNFEIRDSALYFKGASPDFETKPSYSVTITSTDGTLITARDFTINVTNVNEAPTNITLSATRLTENVTVGSGILVGTIGIVDPDASGNANALSLTGTDKDNFEIRGNQLFFTGAAANFETKESYNINIVSTDGLLVTTVPFIITVDDVNEAPTAIALNNQQAILENTTTDVVVGTIELTDPDTNENFRSNVLTLEGDDKDLFRIDGNQLVFKANLSVDYETREDYSVTVVANADTSLAASQAFTINVTNVNEAPVITDSNSGNITIAENAASGTVVSGLTLTGTDVDANTTVTLSLEDDADGLFELVDGQIKLATGKSLDYETADDHTITVKATSDDGSSVTQNFTIAVTNVNEAPVRSSTQIAAAATEDAVKVFTAAELIANYTDPEGDTRSVASVGNFTNGLAVLNDNGTVSFTPAADFSGAASFSYTVKDASGLLGEATTVNLTVANVNDPVQGSVLVTSADGSNKANIALTANTAGLSDADGLGTLAYQWQQSADGQIWTNIGSATASSFTPGNDLIGQSVRVQISYTDLKGQAESVSSATVVVLNPVDPNSTPALTGTAHSFSAIDEDSAVTVTVAELLQGFSDADIADVLSVNGLQVTNATFVANSVNNAVVSYTLTPTANYNGTVALSYQITDGKASIPVSKTITVNAINDAPVLVNPLVDQTVQAGQSKTFDFASTAFADVDGDALTYTATTDTGLELPSWLDFDPVNRSFTVSPLGKHVGAIDVRVTASDGSLSASDVFSINVTAPTGQAMLKDTTSVFTNYLDKTDNGSVDYTTSQAASLAGIYDSQTGLLNYANTGIKIARGNVLALADGNAATVGTTPTLGLQLANVPTLTGTLSSTIDIALTAGIDAATENGQSSVRLSLNIHTLNVEGQLVMRAQTQKATIFVSNGSGTLKEDVEFDFDASDIIASTSPSGGQALLQFNVMSLLAKLDGTVYGQFLGQFLNDGNYTLSIVKTLGADWPLQTDAGKPINGITVGLPITSAAINFVPQLVFGDDIKTGLALDIPPQTVLDLGQFLLTGAGFDASSDQVKRFALSDANGSQDLFKIWFLQPENGQGTLGLRDANTGAITTVQDGQYQALGSEKIYGLAFADLGRLVYTAPNAVADASVNLRFLLEDQQRAFSTIQSIAIDLKPGLQQSSIVTEGQELVLQELSYASTVESLPTQGKVYSAQGESRTELKLGDVVPANAKLVYVGPAVDASSQGPAGQWSVRGFDPVTDTYVTTTRVLAINHLPTISASSNTPATLSEDGTTPGTVQITFADEDSADTAVINLTGWTPGQNGAYTQSLQYGVATLSPVSGQVGQYTLSYLLDARSQALGNTLADDPLTLTVLDSQGASRQTTVTFKVQGINDAATFAAEDGKLFDTVDITETDGVQTFTGQVLVSDVDSPATVVPQTTVGNYGTFSIDTDGAWKYTTKSALNELEATEERSETFTIATADGTTKDIFVNIQGVNDAPVAVDGEPYGTFPINTDVTIDLVDLISDPDNTVEDLTISSLSVTQGQGAVVLNGQQIEYTPALNFSGSVTISYTVQDPAGLSDTGTVTFFVGDNTEPTSANNKLTINEDSTRTLTSADFPFADGDAGQSTLGEVIIKSVPTKGKLFTVVNGLEVDVKANDAFTLDELEEGNLKYRPANNDYGSSYASFNFQVADSGNLASKELYTLVLDVASVNDLPVIDSATSVSVQENTSSVFYTATATDVEKDPLTFSISGADADKFTMDPNTGKLKFTAAPNFEAPGSAAGNNTYSIQLVVNDGDEELVTKDLTITVTNVNEAPVIDSGDTGTVAENSAIGTEVYKARATDVDANTTLIYSLGGTDAAFFNINPSTGVVTLNAAADFEALGRNPEYNVNVIVSDGPLSDSEGVTITVTDVDEAPTAIVLNNQQSIVENTTTQVVVGTIALTDPDNNQSFPANVLTLEGADKDLFSIDGNLLVFNANPSVDYETRRDYSVTVVANAGTALTQSQIFTINVDNVIDTLTLADNTIRVTDHDSSGRATTALVEAQSNGSGTLTLSLSDSDALSRVNLLRLLDGDKNTTGIGPTIEFALQNTDQIALGIHQVHLDLALSNERFNGLSVSVGVDLAIELTRTADGVLQLTMPATPVDLVFKAGGFTVLTKTVQNLDSDTFSLVGGSNGIPNLSVKIDNLFDKAMDSTVAISELGSAGTLAIASGLVMGLLGGKTVGDLLALLKEVITVPNEDDLPSANLTQLFALIKDTISLPADLQQLSFDQVLSVSAQVLNLPDSLKFGDVLTLLRDTIVLPSSLQGTLGSLKETLVDATGEKTVEQLESLARAMLGGTEASIADKTIPELLDLLAASPIAGRSIQSLGSGAVDYFDGINTVALFKDAARVVQAFYGQKTLADLLVAAQSNITLPAELADLQALSLVGLLDLGALAMAAQDLLGSNNLSINGLLNLVQSIVTINGNVDPSRISDLLALIDNSLDLQPLLGTDVNLSDLISNIGDPTLQIHPLLQIAAQTFLSSNGHMQATVDLPTLGLTDATGQLIQQVVVQAPIASIDQLTLDSAYVTVHDVNQNNENTSFSVLGDQNGDTLTLDLSAGQGGTALNRSNILQLFDGDPQTGRSPTLQFALKDTHDVPLGLSTVGVQFSIQNERLASLTMAADFEVQIKLVRDNSGQLQIQLPPQTVQIALSAAGMPVTTVQVSNLSPDMFELVSGTNGTPSLSLKIDSLLDKAIGNTLALSSLSDQGALTLAAGLVMGLVGGKSVGELLGLLKDSVDLSGDLPATSITRLLQLVQDTVTLPPALQNLSIGQLLSTAASVLKLDSSLTVGKLIGVLQDTFELPEQFNTLTLGNLQSQLPNNTSSNEALDRLKSVALALLQEASPNAVLSEVSPLTLSDLLDKIADSTLANQSLDSLGALVNAQISGYNGVALIKDLAIVVNGLIGDTPALQLLKLLQESATLPAALAGLEAISLAELLDLSGLALAAADLLGPENLSIAGLTQLIYEAVTLDGQLNQAQINQAIDTLDTALNLQPLLGKDYALRDLFSNLSDPEIEMLPVIEIASKVLFSSDGQASLQLDLPDSLVLQGTTGQDIQRIVVNVDLSDTPNTAGEFTNLSYQVDSNDGQFDLGSFLADSYVDPQGDALAGVLIGQPWVGDLMLALDNEGQTTFTPLFQNNATMAQVSLDQLSQLVFVAPTTPDGQVLDLGVELQLHAVDSLGAIGEQQLLQLAFGNYPFNGI